MLLFKIVLFLLLSEVTSFGRWNFAFHVDLICRNRYTHVEIPNFCYKVKFFDNGQFKNDKIGEMKKEECSGDKTRVSFNMTGSVFMLTRWNIFLKSSVYHNCTSTGGFIERKRERAKFIDRSNTIYVPLEINLFDKGPE